MANSSESNRGLIIVVVVVLALAVFASNLQPSSSAGPTGAVVSMESIWECRLMHDDCLNRHQGLTTADENARTQCAKVRSDCIDARQFQTRINDPSPIQAQGFGSAQQQGRFDRTDVVKQQVRYYPK